MEFGIVKSCFQSVMDSAAFEAVLLLYKFFFIFLYLFPLFSPVSFAWLNLPSAPFLPSFRNNSKCAELEEELKTVTNNLKSLEAQAEKVG